MMKSLRGVFATALACLTALAAFTAGSRAEPVNLVISYPIVPAHFTPFLFSAEMRKKPDVLRHVGKSYNIDVVQITGAGQATAALAAGRLHFVGSAYQDVANGVLQAKLDIRVVADVIGTGHPGQYAPPMIVRKESGLKTVQDLKGKRLAIFARNSGFDAAVRIEMRKHGFTAGKDYTIVEVPLPNMIPGLKQNLFDAAMLVPPFTLMAERSGEFHTVFSFRDALGPTQTAILFTRQSILAMHPAEIRDFMEDYLRAWRYLNDAKNRDELLRIIAEHMKGKPEQFAWVNTPADEYRSPWAVPDLAMMQKNIDDLAREKFLPGTIKVADYADLSFIQEARRRIESGK